MSNQKVGVKTDKKLSKQGLEYIYRVHMQDKKLNCDVCYESTDI